MPSTVANPFQAMPSAPAASSASPSRPGVTSGLLKLLGSMKPSRPLVSTAGATTLMPGVTPGSSAVLMPQMQSAPLAPVTRPQIPEAASDSSPFSFSSIQRVQAPEPAGTSAISFDQLMAGGASHSGLDHLRQQLFGKYYEDTEARINELRASQEAGLAKTKKAAMDRIEELGVAMQRDLVALRQETHQELEDIKRDVFSAVMSISALNDKLGVSDARVREVTTSLTRSLVDRVEQQAQTFDQTMRHMQMRLDEMINARVATALQRAVQEMIEAQTGQRQTSALGGAPPGTMASVTPPL